jgi:hypothetical protein
MLVRMFGIFGLFLSSGYFLQGGTLVLPVVNLFARRQYEEFVWWFVIASLDLFTAIFLAISAIGLLFVQGWAKKMWLGTLSFLTLLHLMILVLTELGKGGSTFALIWTWMMVLLTALSWWHFTKGPGRSRVSESGT